ncbi:MAG: NTPase [Thermoplasmata archaeon]
MIKGTKIGITGLPGAGKTYALVKVIEMLEGEGVNVGGMITEPILDKKNVVGFKIINWITKKEDVLSHIKFESKQMVGIYGINVEALETIGVNAINEAVMNSDVIIIDEVGKMEVGSEKFIESVKKAIDVDKPLILTLHKKSRNPLLQDIRRRADMRILEVTPINRNLLPYKIIKILKGELL